MSRLRTGVSARHHSANAGQEPPGTRSSTVTPVRGAARSAPSEGPSPSALCTDSRRSAVSSVVAMVRERRPDHSSVRAQWDPPASAAPKRCTTRSGLSGSPPFVASWVATRARRVWTSAGTRRWSTAGPRRRRPCSGRAASSTGVSTTGPSAPAPGGPQRVRRPPRVTETLVRGTWGLNRCRAGWHPRGEPPASGRRAGPSRVTIAIPQGMWLSGERTTTSSN